MASALISCTIAPKVPGVVCPLAMSFQTVLAISATAVGARTSLSITLSAISITWLCRVSVPSTRLL